MVKVRTDGMVDPCVKQATTGRERETRRVPGYDDHKREGPMIGEKIYEYDLDVTGVTDFGVALDAIVCGKVHIDAYMQ